MQPDAEPTPPPPTFGSNECRQLFSTALDAHVALVERLRSRAQQRVEVGWTAFYALTFAAISTAESIKMLAAFGKSRDCAVLARAVLETSVNALLVVTDDKFAEQMRRHTEQKEFRDYQRVLAFNQEHFGAPKGVELRPDAVPGLKESLDAFTGRKGREITSWTPKTVEERIQALIEAHGKPVAGVLRVVLFAVYREASEVLHGTVWGVLRPMGEGPAARREHSPKGIQDYQRAMICEYLFLLSMVFRVVIEVSAKLLDMPELVHDCRAQTEVIARVMHAQPRVVGGAT